MLNTSTRSASIFASSIIYFQKSLPSKPFYNHFFQSTKQAAATVAPNDNRWHIYSPRIVKVLEKIDHHLCNRLRYWRGPTPTLATLTHAFMKGLCGGGRHIYVGYMQDAEGVKRGKRESPVVWDGANVCKLSSSRIEVEEGYCMMVLVCSIKDFLFKEEESKVGEITGSSVIESSITNYFNSVQLS